MKIKLLIAVLTAAVVLTGCVTKGYVRRSMADCRANVNCPNPK